MNALTFINNVQRILPPERKRDYKGAIVIVLREHFLLPIKTIGEILGYADHTAFYHYKNKHKGAYQYDPIYREVYDQVYELAKESTPINPILELIKKKIDEAKFL